jgi:hypothetical protein
MRWLACKRWNAFGVVRVKANTCLPFGVSERVNQRSAASASFIWPNTPNNNRKRNGARLIMAPSRWVC